MATRRGDTAKNLITKTILSTFEGSFINDKKIYIPMKDGDNGEIIQIALSLTMPKTPVEPAGMRDNKSTISSAAITATEMSDADKAKVEELMRKLNITPVN